MCVRVERGENGRTYLASLHILLILAMKGRSWSDLTYTKSPARGRDHNIITSDMGVTTTPSPPPTYPVGSGHHQYSTAHSRYTQSQGLARSPAHSRETQPFNDEVISLLTFFIE